MSRLFTILASLTLSLLPFRSQAVWHEPYDLPRIYWDIASRQQIFPSGNYARMIPLQDGRLMIVAEAGGGISCSYSDDGGATWSAPGLIVGNASNLPYAVPDLIQLVDGTIIVGFNPRPSQPYSDDRRFGIRVMRSCDNGRTWQGPIFVYDAQPNFKDGCWEPSFLELPDGELQLYFANENNFTHSDEQEISMCRSFDKGQTWSEPVRISYRAGCRDGMPVPLLTDSSEIVVIIEDNGHPECRGFRVTTVRSPLSHNWAEWVDAQSTDRQMIFADRLDKEAVSAAPYLRKLKGGSTVASWQGNGDDRSGLGEGQYDMFVAVGDAHARGFRAISRPFGLPLDKHALWNSLGIDHDGNVFAIASIGDMGKGNAINIMKGYPMKCFTADYMPSCGEKQTSPNEIFMGAVTRKRSAMHFRYDADKLYFHARVLDGNVNADMSDNDGITLALDMANRSDTSPQKGIYRIILGANGTINISEGDAGKWNEIQTPEDISFGTDIRSTHYDVDLALPWTALGCESAPVGRDMRCLIEVRDRRDSALLRDTIPDADQNQSWTWPQLRLSPD